MLYHMSCLPGSKCVLRECVPCCTTNKELDTVVSRLLTDKVMVNTQDQDVIGPSIMQRDAACLHMGVVEAVLAVNTALRLVLAAHVVPASHSFYHSLHQWLVTLLSWAGIHLIPLEVAACDILGPTATLHGVRCFCSHDSSDHKLSWVS